MLLEQVMKASMAIDKIRIALEVLDYFFRELLHQNCLHFYLENKALVAVN